MNLNPFKSIKNKIFDEKISIIDMPITMHMRTSLWIAYINLAFENLDLAIKEKALEIRRRRIISTVVFVGACLETFINEYGIENISEEWESIERLPLSDKWLIVIKLIGKGKLSRNSSMFKDILWVKNFRNNIMHYKPKFEKLNKGQSTTNINSLLVMENAQKSCGILKNSIKTFFDLTKLPVPDAVYGWKIILPKD